MALGLRLAKSLVDRVGPLVVLVGPLVVLIGPLVVLGRRGQPLR